MKQIGEVVKLPARFVGTPVSSNQQPVALPVAVQDARSPAAVDGALQRALPPSIKAGLRSRVSFGTSDSYLVGFDVVRPIDTADARQVLAWLTAIDTRPTRTQAVMEITRCLSVTAARAKDQTDLKAMIAVLAEELAEFPADVVEDELRTWARGEKWWPTLAELRARCLEATRYRRHLKSTLETVLSRPDAR